MNGISALSGNRITQNANDTWSYDDNGNMTHNALKELDLEYNLLNLPREARHINDTVSYRYLVDGTKLSALTNVGDGLKYRGNFVYDHDNKYSIYSTTICTLCLV